MPHETACNPNWADLIPEDHWRIYKCVLDAARAEQIPFALGGGLAVGCYTGKLRHTKDIDLYILPSDRERVVQMMTDCGLKDLHDEKPYVRDWIYRGHQGEVIVDAIWAMANKRAQVDEDWVQRGNYVRMFEEEFRIIPPEELIWSKLYVLQRDRCDWPDIINLVHATGPGLDWDHLIRRVGDDKPLLKGLLQVFVWVATERASAVIPKRIMDSLNLQMPSPEPEGQPSRVDLLDTRPWMLNAA